MGTNTRVVGYCQADETWVNMATIWRSCEKANVTIPDEVQDFFEGDDPGDEPGMEISIQDAVTPYSADMKEGYEIDVSKLPSNIKVVRIYNSY